MPLTGPAEGKKVVERETKNCADRLDKESDIVLHSIVLY